MSLELSVRAINLIMAFPYDSCWRSSYCVDELDYALRRLFLDHLRNYSHRFLERRLLLPKSLTEKDLRDIFAHGKPLGYDEKDYPRTIVPKIVEAFQLLTNEPSFLDITVSVPMKGYWESQCANRMSVSMGHPTEIWPQVYDYYLPCNACTRVETSRTFRTNNVQPWESSSELSLPPETTLAHYVLENFHVPSKHFRKQLTVELHFALGDPEKFGDVPVHPTAPKVEKCRLRKVTIRLVDEGCRGSTHAVARLSKSILLIPDFALGVYRFVDRANIGASFIANSGLCDVICSLQKKLPVHHLMCEFEETSFRKGFHSSPSYYYWLNLHHFRRDLTYSDVRRFRIPSTAGLQSTADDCALILRYLSNSHVADFIAPVDHPEFSVKMLAALADRNGSSHFSMGLLRLRVLRGRLTDYRSVDAVFGGGMQLGALDLRLHEDCLQRLVEATDFLRMPVVQRLTEFKLRLINYADLESSRRPVVNSPMWTAGVHLLCNCALYQVEWQWHARADCSEPAILHVRYERHLESIALRLVQICEDFERGEVTATAAHSVFRFPTLVAFPFKVTNKEDPVTVVKKDGWPGFSSYTWDVYRFRNAVTGEWLTACVGRTPSDPFDDSLCYSMLHIVKGHVCPDASYVH